MSYSRIGIVTGANKGIGLAIVRQLALQYPRSSLNTGPFLIYLTARDKNRGETALKALREDAQLQKAQALKEHGGPSEIKYHQLDITDRNSVDAFAAHLKQAHGDGVDFVINNAGIAMDGFNPLVVKTTLGCNYYSTMEASHIFLPLIKLGGRLVNVASSVGKLGNKYSEQIKSRFLNSQSEEDITSIMKDFASAVEAGREKDAGFPSLAYGVSKAGLIGATRALARKEKEKGNTVLINSCCPGYVNTDMSKGNGVLTPDQGAETPVFLALGDIHGTTGEFWKDKKPCGWES